MGPKERFLAIQAREKLGVSLLEPIENIGNLLFKKEGISIIKKKMESKISGMCAKNDEGIMAMLINTSYSLGRQNFTIAHEYYHLVFEEDLNKKSKNSETKANTFASYFIMPKEALEYYLEKKSVGKKKDDLMEDDIIDISRYFKMSYLAVIVRLEIFEKLISKEKASEYRRLNAIKLAQSNGIQTDLYESTEEKFLAKTNYVEEAKKAFENNKISRGKYESLLIGGGFEDIVFGLDSSSIQEVKDGNIEDYL